MSGRIYSNLIDAIEETQRELFEMGITIQNYSFQDKIVEGNDDYRTLELQAYNFSVITPTIESALTTIQKWYGSDVMQWAKEELTERIGSPRNPGNAWTARSEIWTQFLETDGKFAYTYSERIAPQIDKVIAELQEHPNTRQAIIEIHNNLIDIDRIGGKRRIPCSMFYQFMIRNGTLDCIYVMRSSDFLTHFVNDIGLAVMLQNHIQQQLVDCNCGNLHVFISSLHAFYKDLKAKGIF